VGYFNQIAEWDERRADAWTTTTRFRRAERDRWTRTRTGVEARVCFTDDERTNGRTDERTNGRTDESTNRNLGVGKLTIESRKKYL